ncbi:MAG: DUF11 domain-containing protein [Clostridia bacterium]|nr:DUF11 domain-containing protein [Clostridia bacterium]
MAIFYNQATITYNGNTVTSNRVVGEIEEPLSIDKSALEENYRPNEPVNYVISFTNTIDTDITNASVSDNLGLYEFTPETEETPINLRSMTFVDGSGRYYVNSIEQTENLPTFELDAEGNLNITGITVPANGDAMVIYKAVPNEFAPLGEDTPAVARTITNIATLTSDASEEKPTATLTLPANLEPELSLEKNISPVPVIDNGEITYTFDITNTGATAATGVVFADTFDPILSNVTATLDGNPFTGFDYNETTGEFTVDSLDVPAATYTQDETTGEWETTPGTATLVVKGTI